MRSAEIRERSFVIGCTSVCVLAAGVAWLANPSELTLSLALVSLVPPLTVAFVRAARHGIVDPLAVFSLCFAAYNGVLLVRLNYSADPQQTPFATDGTTFFRSGVLSGLGSLGLVVGWLVSKSGNPGQIKEGTPTKCTAAFLTGIVTYFGGLALYMAQYWQVGGYMQSVAMDRGQRFEMLTQTVSMPYEGFIVSGLSLMAYASFGQARSRRILSSAASLLWLGLVLLQGDRRLALQTVMALGVVIGTLRPKYTRLRPLAVIGIALAYFGAVIYGQYRTLIYDLASGRSTFKQARVAAEGEDSILSKPEQSELGGPYMSVLYYSSGNEPLWWGLSYGMSIPAVLPRVLYPGVKAPAISANLDEALHEGVGPVYGWGFNPVAEGFVNFGLPGAFGAMVLWSMFFAWLGANRYRSLAGLVACATLLQEAVNANRIDFRYVYFESIYCVSVGVLAVVLMKAAMELAVKSRNPVRILISGSQLIPLRKSNPF